MGGDSLKAMRIINEIREAFKLEDQVSMSLIFSALTIKKLSDEIDDILGDLEIYSI